MTTTMTLDTVERQKKYVDDQRARGNGVGIVFADAFIRGIRDLGYKNPAWAMAEMIDNSVQASAGSVSIRFGYAADNPGKTKPDMLAVIDDGSGMIPEMIGYSVRWGGTDREDDRKGFGRYGYGLPSSALYLARSYTVFSKVSGAGWHAVTVDIDQMAAVAADKVKTEELLTARPCALPDWVVGAEDRVDLIGLDHGTVVVLENLDRLKRMSGWVTASTLKAKLHEHLGVIYRHWLSRCKIVVDGEFTSPVDPLFLMEHAKFYDETAVMAQRIEANAAFEAVMKGGVKGMVRIRASVLPPNFQAADPDRLVGKQKMNKRKKVLTEYNGIIFCREQRQIDCVAPWWTKFQTYGENIKVEVDFEPTLDEYFGVTTSKQQIRLDDEMEEKLKQDGKQCGGLYSLVQSMRREFDRMGDVLDAKREEAEKQAEEQRASTQAMEETEKFKDKVQPPTPKQQEEAEKNLDKAATEEAGRTGRPKEEVKKDLLEKTQARKWEVTFDAISEGPFFRPVRLGEQKRVVINTEHPFYAKVYQGAGLGKSALEVLLFVLAERELEGRDEAQAFYKVERQKWSERLRYALDHLIADETAANRQAHIRELMYETRESAPAEDSV